MSNRRYIICSVTIVALLATGFLMTFRFAESKSISNVLNKHAQLLKAPTQGPADKTMLRKKFDTHKYLNQLSQIDPSFCSKKFETAWLDYIQATEPASDQKLLRYELIVGMIGVATKSPSLTPLLAKPLEARDEVERACQNVERVAWEYGVRIIPQS
jgi:hypothetical protein